MMKSVLVVVVMAAGCGVDNAGDENTAADTSDGKGDQATQKANLKTLECSGGQSYLQFRATLDSSGFVPGSGYFTVRNARVVDNYATAEKMVCTGSRLGEIDCIGFWFNTADFVAEVTTRETAAGVTASHATLRGGLVDPAGPWPCTVK